MRRLLPLMALLLAVGVYLVDRRLVLAGAGHLLFDLNPAEQGFIRVVSPWLHQDLGDVLTEPSRRGRFLRDSQAVGNQVHGTLALSLAALHQAAAAGMELGTLTLRRLALGASALTLVCWMAALWRVTRRVWASLIFAALFTVAPTVLLKLTLVHWGTHEVVMLLHAVSVLILAPWLAGRGRPWTGGVVAGALAALGLLANAALLLPGAAAAGWIALRRPWRAALSAAAGAAAAFTTTMALVRSQGWLAGLGQPRALWGEPLLVGKQGRGFLLSQGLDTWTLWDAEIAARALPLVPGPGYGAAAAWLEPAVRGGLAALAVGAVLGLLHRGRRADGSARLAAFLGLYGVAGWVAITLLGQSHGLDPGIKGGIQPRYYAHLYPVVLAFVALWSTRSRWRIALPAALLFFGSFDHQRLFDARQPSDPAEAAVGRCDATAAWLARASDRSPPPDRVPHGARSEAFLAGLSLVEAFHYRDYWRWTWPAAITPERVEEAAAQGARSAGDLARDTDFAEGQVLAARCLLGG